MVIVIAAGVGTLMAVFVIYACIVVGSRMDEQLLYGILMDRMQLSAKNGWIDEDGKVFIYYQRQKIMDALTCGNKKAGQLLAELDDKNGIGLITRIHQGLGKPDKIYVHKCIIPEMKAWGSPRQGMDDLTDEGSSVETTLQYKSQTAHTILTK